jgi:DNA-binding LytR/AlgR family response regulator
VDTLVNIAICDDEKSYVDTLLNDITEIYGENNSFHFRSFNSGEDIISNFSRGEFDIIFMDIEMKELDGLKTAEYIRSIDRNVILAFLTNYDKFVYSGYEVNAFRYILKDQARPIYLKQIKDTIDEYSRKFKYITIYLNDVLQKLMIDDIYYIEVYSREIIIHLADKCHRTTGKLKDYETNLKGMYFAKPDKSHLVNAANIDFVEKDRLLLKNGEHLYISRKHYKEIVDTFVEYTKSRCI